MEREKGEELSSPFLILDELNAAPPRAEPADVGDNVLDPNRPFPLSSDGQTTPHLIGPHRGENAQSDEQTI